jgi:hypothetical protein
MPVPATPTDLPAWIAVGLCTEEVVRRLPAAIRNPRSRTLWFVFLALDISMLNKVQAIGDFLYHLTGIDDIATLTKHLAGIAAVAGILRWVTRVVPGRMEGQREPTYRMLISSNPRRIATWAVVVTITLLFPFSQRRTGNMEDSDFIFVQAGHVWGSLHLLLFYAYLCFGMICTSMMCASASREPSAKGAFKYGMQAVSLGGVVGSLYGLIRSGYLIARLADRPFLGGDGFVGTASNFCLVICIVLVVTGLAAPKWERMDQLVKTHGAINDLRPLWRDLTVVVPTVCYDGSPGSPGLMANLQGQLHDFWSWKHLERRLSKRINEINDASLHLAPYVPPPLPGQVRTAARALGLPQHVATAYLLRTAIQRKLGHEPPFDGEPDTMLKAGRDLLTTTSALLPVGKAMGDQTQMGLLDRRLTTGVHA